MEAPFVRSAYNYDREQASDLSGLLCEDESLAKQSFKEECDINTIVRNFGLTGELPGNIRPPTYGDFEGIFDYQSALNAVIAAQEAFMELPVDIRIRFHHDPAAFVDFCSNPENLPELRKMGLAVPEVTTPLQTGSGGEPQAKPEAKEGA